MAKTQFSRNPGNINGAKCVQKKSLRTLFLRGRHDFLADHSLDDAVSFEVTEESQAGLERKVAMWAHDGLKVFGDVPDVVAVFQLVLQVRVHQVTVKLQLCAKPGMVTIEI